MTELGVTSEPLRGADPLLIGRLVDAFLRAEPQATYADDSMWTGIRQMHHAAVTVLQSRDVGAVSRLLAHPHEGYLFYGFEDLGVWSVDAYKKPDRRTGYAAHCSELLRQLARAVGVLPLHNPEPGNHVVAVPPMPELLDQIAAAVGFSLEAADTVSEVLRPRYAARYHGRTGLECDIRGLPDSAVDRGDAHPRVLEIGAGLGRTAAYCFRAGITDYWIVDVPMTHLAQGHFLGHAIGADHLVLDGEPAGIRGRMQSSSCHPSDSFPSGCRRST